MKSINNHSPSLAWLATLVTFALIAFAANSVLCRLALGEGKIDAASFTFVRLASGAVFLWCLCAWKRYRYGGQKHQNKSELKQSSNEILSWSTFFGAGFLFLYAGAFSLAYLKLDTGTGALILFASVQFTMLFYALVTGRRFSLLEITGVLLALSGLIYLVLPTATRPSVVGFSLMLIAGAAWGGYTLLGRGVKDATEATKTHFIGALPFAVGFLIWNSDFIMVEMSGLIYALLSGMLASGAGYALWFYCLKYLSIPNAASCQLSVPFIAAVGGVMFNGESLSLRFLLALVLVVLGIAFVIHAQFGSRRRPQVDSI